jgi:hypothetical protein
MKIKLEHLKSAYESQDLQFIALLDGDDTFDELIQKARDMVGIKKLLTSYSSPEFYTMVYEESKKICSFYSLPNAWIHPIASLIAFDIFPTPGIGTYLSGETKDETGKYKDLTITISQQTSFEALLDWLEQHRSVIQERLKHLPRKASKVTNFKLKLGAFSLHRKGYTPKQIETELSKQYESDNETYDALYRENIYHWISDLKKLLKRQPLKSGKR